MFAYVIEGKGYFCGEKDPFTYDIAGANYFDMQRDPFIANGMIVLFTDGDEIVVMTEKKPLRFLLISGKPIGEPVAWYGPIVMNTQGNCVLLLRSTAVGGLLSMGSKTGSLQGRPPVWARQKPQNHWLAPGQKRYIV